MKDQINKKSLLYGIGGVILGSALGASGIIILSSFEGPAITNTIALIGGLGGGAISGGLTFWGVKHTIKAQREKDELEILPRWIMTLEKIKKTLEEWAADKDSFIYSIQNFENHQRKSQLRTEAIEKFQRDTEKLRIGLSSDYLQADGNVYAKVKVFLNKTRIIAEDMKKIEEDPTECSLKDLQEIHAKKLEDLNTKTKELENFLQESLKAYEEKLFSYYN